MTKQCSALNKKGQRCGSWCLKNEDFCVVHSQSERGAKLRAKALSESRRILKLMYPEWGEGKKGSTGELTAYGIVRDFRRIRRRIMRDPNLREDKRLNALIKVDKHLEEVLKVFYQQAQKQKESFEEKLRIAQEEKAEKES